MTCEEFRAIIRLDPENCTRGERAAFSRHLYWCKSCERWFEALPEEKLSQEAEKEMISIRNADFADPEYLGTVYEKPS